MQRFLCSKANAHIRFKYERLPIMCYWCGKLSHSDKDCELWVRSNGLLTESDRQFDAWLHAPVQHKEMLGNSGGWRRWSKVWWIGPGGGQRGSGSFRKPEWEWIQLSERWEPPVEGGDQWADSYKQGNITWDRRCYFKIW